jgi:hypothetical protein
MEKIFEKNLEKKEKKFPKFKRNSVSPQKQIAIQPRDIEIFKKLAEFRFLDTRHINLLCPGKGGPRYNQRRLEQLYRRFYIDRPRSQLSYYKTRGDIIYALGRKGAEAIYNTVPGVQGKIDWQQKNREAKYPFIEHTIMMSDFRVALILALKNHPTARLAQWQQGEELKDKVVLKGKITSIIPDAFFTIHKQDKNKALHFFLEADRSSMDQSTFFQKMLAYREWYKKGGHRKKFNIDSFRVLTITISEERKENMRMRSKKADAGKGSTMLLFTCEKNYSFEKPETILAPIWQSSLDNIPHSLLG